MLSFQQILNSSYQIKEYFNRNTQTMSECFKLASQLLIESIRRRQQSVKPLQIEQSNCNKSSKDKRNTPKNRYNVAYIKHNRFLSPSQKREVTPKVTEVIPYSPQKIFIYGKPKVQLDNGYGCSLHEQNCENFSQTHQNEFNRQQQKQNKYKTSPNILDSDQYSIAVPRQYEQYLSPKAKQKKKNYKFNHLADQNQTLGTVCSPKNKKPDTVCNGMTGTKSYINQSNQTCTQNYSNVQSKIKELIQRDKKNRETQKQVEKQKKQILQIQARQNQLLMMQKYQQDLLRNQRNQQIQHWNNKLSNNFINANQKYFGVQSSFDSSSEESIVNLHGHKEEDSRIECYQCEIERLRKRKQKANKAIKQIQREEAKRSKLLLSIAQNSQMTGGINRYADQSDQSVTIY